MVLLPFANHEIANLLLFHKRGHLQSICLYQVKRSLRAPFLFTFLEKRIMMALPTLGNSQGSE